ncbi:LysR family transcriptional regulator [Burkholderia sp. WAC0059]|uniref:LysR family transcriptional regulator n=1 Tax=Burkholderia sp. WAC0059 TaxID=2066022 RepID=UPI000C7ED8BB|nr:LysR family transcriptional regulator [Burkholderia sp. WAC0059]PLZ02425.1 LysR family transcriptional regulator [Burkholderia sp. WAC0059]
MELRHLRYFIAVAESQSFRVASERIHVTQPAITRQIQDLEAEVGVLLFQRTTAGVVLTPAGELFLREVRVALSVLTAATRSAKRVAAGLEGSLRIGFVENSGWEGLVPDVFARYQAQAQDIHLELLPMNSPEQVESLAAGRLDGGFIYTFDELPTEISTIPLMHRSVLLAVPRQWGWPDNRTVCANELNDKPVIAFPRYTYPAYHDYLIQACREAGLTLNVVQEVTTEAAILSLVSAGIGAAIVNAGNLGRQPVRVQLLELSDLPLVIPLAFAYPRQNQNPALARFILMLKSLHAEMID